MKAMETAVPSDGDPSKDFTIDDLALLKEMLLKLETAIDEIELTNKQAGTTFGGSYIFELLGKAEVIDWMSEKVFFLHLLCNYSISLPGANR